MYEFDCTGGEVAGVDEEIWVETENGPDKVADSTADFQEVDITSITISSSIIIRRQFLEIPISPMPVFISIRRITFIKDIPMTSSFVDVFVCPEIGYCFFVSF